MATLNGMPARVLLVHSSWRWRLKAVLATICRLTRRRQRLGWLVLALPPSSLSCLADDRRWRMAGKRKPRSPLFSHPHRRVGSSEPRSLDRFQLCHLIVEELHQSACVIRRKVAAGLLGEGHGNVRPRQRPMMPAPSAPGAKTRVGVDQLGSPGRGKGSTVEVSP